MTVAANKAFKLAATSVMVSAGNSGTSTVTITPQNGYTGTVAWTVSSSPSLSNGCFVLPNTAVSGTSAVRATLTLHTIASACTNSAVAVASSSRRDILLGAAPSASRADLQLFSPLHATQASMAIAGLLFVGLLGRRSRRLATLAGICTLAVVGLVASGCAGVSSAAPQSSTSAAKGTYTITIVGA
ncbi:MAG: hypothetical protein DMG49_26915 [Acidobacteria bacterium]|nr:MAG: hypothetical protein DMG49_26915 [Acidobacteriota bacterium]